MEKHFFYRSFVSTIILILSGILIQGCSQGDFQPTETKANIIEPSGEPSPTILPTATKEPVTELAGQISIWHSFEENEMGSLSAVITNFQDMNPEVEFDVLYVPHYDLLNKYESSARDGGVPCILIGSADWGPPLFDSNLIQDITQFAEEDFLATVNPIALGSVQYSNSLIGLPLNMTGVVLFRNQSIIPDAPATIDDLVEFAQQATSGDVVGAYLDYGLYFSGGHLDGIGGQLMDSEGNPTFNDDKGLEWIELIRRFEEAGPVENNDDNDINLFNQGKVGTIIAELRNASTIIEAIGSENLAIDPWPTPMSGYVQTENLYLNSNSAGKVMETCWNFMNFLLTDETQLIFADPDMAGFIPSIQGVKLSDPLRMQAMESFSGGAVFPVIPEMNVYWDPVNSALLSVIEQGIDPADALQTAYDIVVSELEANQGK